VICVLVLNVTYGRIPFYSCRAPSRNLDGYEESNRPRTREITEALVQTFDVPDLWSDHGIISDVVVSVDSFVLKIDLNHRS
jgi:hypothetical protein